jgi:hypothetical protein
MGLQNVYKTYVFPFPEYYIAVVFNLGAYDPGAVEPVIDMFRAGEYPIEKIDKMQIMDALALSIHFQSLQP